METARQLQYDADTPLDYGSHVDAVSKVRGALILLIVLAHSAFGTPPYKDITPESYAGFTRFYDFVFDHLFNCLVPTFFVISGFMFYRAGLDITYGEYKSKIRRRVRTLLIPYLLWNLIALLMISIKLWSPISGYFQGYENFEFTPANILRGFIYFDNGFYPYCFTMWFLRDLMIITLLSPLIVAFVRTFKNYCMLVGIIVLIACDLWLPIVHYWGLTDHALFFTLGVYMAGRGRDSLGRLNIAALCAAYLAMSLVQAVWPDSQIFVEIINYFKKPVMTLLLIGIGLRLYRRPTPVLEFLVGSSFFIYAFHGLFSNFTAKMLVRLIPPTTDLAAFTIYTLKFLILMGISVGAYLGIRRVAPRVLALLCGGRY